jgi:hypothetical protein
MRPITTCVTLAVVAIASASSNRVTEVITSTRPPSARGWPFLHVEHHSYE